MAKEKGEVFIQLAFGVVNENSSVKNLHAGPQWEFSQTFAIGYNFPKPVLGGQFSVRWDAVNSREQGANRDIFWTAPKASLRFNL